MRSPYPATFVPIAGLGAVCVAYALWVVATADCNVCAACNTCAAYKDGQFDSPRLTSLLVSGAIALAITILFYRTVVPLLGYSNRIRDHVDRHFLAYACCIAAIALVTSLFVSKVVLSNFAHSADEFVYLFQAETFRDGRLWNSPPPISHHLSSPHIIETTDKWVGRFSPGWPAIIALFSTIGLEAWMVNPVLNGLTAFLVACLGREMRDGFTGILAAILYVATAFSIFNGASYYNHTLTACCAVAFALFGIRFLKSPTLGNAIASGATLGLMGLTRTYSAALFAIPFGINVLMTQGSVSCHAGTGWLRARWTSVSDCHAALQLDDYRKRATGSADAL